MKVFLTTILVVDVAAVCLLVAIGYAMLVDVIRQRRERRARHLQIVADRLLGRRTAGNLDTIAVLLAPGERILRP